MEKKIHLYLSALKEMRKKIFSLKRINSIHGLEKEEVGKEGKE